MGNFIIRLIMKSIYKIGMAVGSAGSLVHFGRKQRTALADGYYGKEPEKLKDYLAKDNVLRDLPLHVSPPQKGTKRIIVSGESIQSLLVTYYLLSNEQF